MTTTTVDLYTPVDGMEPGDSAWLKVMSASKVAAILGLSHYESRFSLWHLMNGSLSREEETKVQSRGHYVEPAIAAWFADQHPDWTIYDAGTYRNHDRAWQVASPDRWISDQDGQLVTFVECKSDGARDWEWGPAGSDVIPIAYRVQVMWAMDTLGMDHAHVAVLLPYLEFREYRIEYDPDDAAYLRAEAAAFMDSLAAGTPPDRDDSDHTYEAVRRMAPGIDNREVELTEDTYRSYVDALIADKEAKRAVNKAKGDLLTEMDGARVAKFQKRTIATLQTRGGSPFPVQARGLIEKETS